MEKCISTCVEKLGQAVGFDTRFKYGKNDRSYGDFTSYYVFHEQPNQPAAVNRSGRRRTLSRHLQASSIFDRRHLRNSGHQIILATSQFLEDYFPGEFRVDPQPDNFLSLTKWDEFYTLTLIGRWQLNKWQEVTEREPELVFDFKQHRLFGWPVYYDGESSVGEYRRAFALGPEFNGFDFPDYDASRFDTFHQLSYPTQFFGWLNITPRLGFRATYYNRSGTFESFAGQTVEIDPVTGLPQVITSPSIESTPLNAPTPNLVTSGGRFRPVVNAGVEVSTKLSKAYERVQSRWLGLDGLRHVIQPYVNYSIVENFGPPPQEILQFDRVVPSTELLPITFPQFTAIDTIDTWNILRLGVRNRLQTRRDQITHQWMTLDTFLDINFDNPYSDADVSNLFNIYSLRPVPWFTLTIASQLPIVDEGFYEFNTGFNFMPTRNFTFRIGHQYIDNNIFFADNSQVDFYAYLRINDNWAVSVYEQYEFFTQVWQYQRYMIHRDLSSWVASLGAQLRESEGQGDPDVGILFILTLKDAPQVTLPISFDTATDPDRAGCQCELGCKDSEQFSKKIPDLNSPKATVARYRLRLWPIMLKFRMLGVHAPNLVAHPIDLLPIAWDNSETRGCEILPDARILRKPTA